MEPGRLLRWVIGVGDLDGGEERDLEVFYVATYPRLVAVVGLLAQDRHEAEEAVQDAFVRLMSRWERVSRYDDPEAWVRKVALGFLSNRRRKISRGITALARHGAPPDIPAVTGDAVDRQRALDRLPRQQREALVLQDLGMTVEAIAYDLGVPSGTVKSRLSRARAALAPMLREEAPDHV